MGGPQNGWPTHFSSRSYAHAAGHVTSPSELPTLVGSCLTLQCLGSMPFQRAFGKRHVAGYLGRRHVSGYLGRRYVAGYLGRRHVAGYLGRRHVAG